VHRQRTRLDYTLAGARPDSRHLRYYGEKAVHEHGWFFTSSIPQPAREGALLKFLPSTRPCWLAGIITAQNIWGITASDSAKGYKAWGGPPAKGPIDGSVVPCAAGCSLMLAPQVCLPALMEMRRAIGDRIYKRYGFVDAFHPTNGWTDRDVIGIDVGITLLSAENLRAGKV
jgi:hypothetical protein